MRAVPRYLSPIPEGTDIEHAHIGGRLQRLPMTPQGELVAGVLEAKRENGMPLYSKLTVEIPRRSTKTTSIQNVLLGRCQEIPGYQVVSTAQDGTRSSEFMADLMEQIENHVNDIVERRNDELEEAWEDQEGEPKEFTFKDGLAELGIRQLYRSQGREFIKWRNGSKWKAVPPEASKLRGKGVRVVWFDEGGELDPVEGPALLAGALPMLDTNPDAQIIVSGTPGPVRAGMFWDSLETARNNPTKFGIVDYTAEHEDGTYDDPNSEDTWWETHPGLACGLTTIDVIRERHGEGGLDLPKFMMEYLCIWPPDAKTTALNLKNWRITQCEYTPEPPAVAWGIGYDVAQGGHVASVAVAWIDEDGELWGQVMDKRPGAQWLTAYLARANAKFPKVTIGYDSIGENITAAHALGRLPRFRDKSLKPLTLKEVAAATAMIAQSVSGMTIHHGGPHNGLDNAVKSATWRESNGSRLFMRSKGAEISDLLALTHAAAVASTAKRTRRNELPAAVAV